MNMYLFSVLLAVFSLSDCRKDRMPNMGNRTMPVARITVNRKIAEISSTAGSTTPIDLIGGFGSELKSWQELYAALPANATVFTYNRAGLGASENIPGSRDARTIALEYGGSTAGSGCPLDAGKIIS